MTAADLHEGKPVQIRWGEHWIDATVHRVYEHGADVTANARGLFYVQFPSIRERRAP